MHSNAMGKFRGIFRSVNVAALMGIFLLPLIGSPSCAGESKSLTPDEARQVLAEEFDPITNPWWQCFPIGLNMNITNNPWDKGNWTTENGKKRVLSHLDYSKIKLVSELGYLQITGETEPDIMTQSLSKISAVPVPAQNDERFEYVRYEEFLETGQVCIRTGWERIDKVISAETKESTLDNFVVVRGFSTFEKYPFFKYYEIAAERDLYESYVIKTGLNRKFLALLKYDLFKEKWIVKAWDFAGVDQDFFTNSVASALQN